MTARRARYLAELGIPVWRLRALGAEEPELPGASLAPAIPSSASAVDLAWAGRFARGVDVRRCLNGALRTRVSANPRRVRACGDVEETSG